MLYIQGQELLDLNSDAIAYPLLVDREDVAQWIKSARTAKGWTQADLGERMGVTKGNVSHWENGKHDPSFLQLLRIRDLTGHPLREIEAPGSWPLPCVPREAITSLEPDQRARLEIGIQGILAALAPVAKPSKRSGTHG